MNGTRQTLPFLCFYLDNAAPAWYFWFGVRSDRGVGGFRPGLAARCDEGSRADHVLRYPTVSIQDRHFAMRLASCLVAGHGRIPEIQRRQAAVLPKLRHRHFEHTRIHTYTHRHAREHARQAGRQAGWHAAWVAKPYVSAALQFPAWPIASSEHTHAVVPYHHLSAHKSVGCLRADGLARRIVPWKRQTTAISIMRQLDNSSGGRADSGGDVARRSPERSVQTCRRAPLRADVNLRSVTAVTAEQWSRFGAVVRLSSAARSPR